jgi:hypothetical protein
VKYFCFVLSVFVIFLSVKPCCQDNDCYGKYAVEKRQQKDTNNKDCQGCSPFFSCGTCSGFVVSKPVNIIAALIPEPQIEHFANYRQPFIKQVSLAIWQPPKLS